MVGEESVLFGYLDVVSSKGSNEIEYVRATLHHFTDVIQMAIKSTNPEAAVSNKQFYLDDIKQGLFNKLISGSYFSYILGSSEILIFFQTTTDVGHSFHEYKTEKYGL